jgi:hypothetical protein
MRFMGGCEQTETFLRLFLIPGVHRPLIGPRGFLTLWACGGVRGARGLAKPGLLQILISLSPRRVQRIAFPS